MNTKETIDRRNFFKTTAAITCSLTNGVLVPGIASASDISPISTTAADNINIIGPKEGFSPHIGTIVSMMNWMRMVVLRSVSNLKVEQLDYLHDPKSNTIGAMLLHLAATEKYYQLHTFDNVKWGSWSDDIKKKWDIPMGLGDQGRKTIKGNSLDYYLNILKEIRERTIEEFKKRDDAWLMSVDQKWGWGPTNNYCKWFHVCEHESNHNGQIKWIKSRLPGAKAGND